MPLAAVGVMERNRIIDEEEAMEIEMDMDAEDAPAAEEPMEVRLHGLGPSGMRPPWIGT